MGGLLPALAMVDLDGVSAKRRDEYQSCETFGYSVGAIGVFSKLPENCVPYAYAFRGDDKVVSKMKSYATRNGFDLVKWPFLPSDIFEHSPNYYRDVFLVILHERLETISGTTRF